MLNELKPTLGARKERKRLGRGVGSGTGKTSGKGHKGQKARSGKTLRPGFEGGQIPFFQRIPKRGFKNINRVEYEIVNLEDLNKFENETLVDIHELKLKKLISKKDVTVKILGNGTLEKKLTVKAHRFSKSAKEAIEKNGGTTEVI